MKKFPYVFIGSTPPHYPLPFRTFFDQHGRLADKKIRYGPDEQPYDPGMREKSAFNPAYWRTTEPMNQ